MENIEDKLIDFKTAKLAKKKGFVAEWKLGQLSYNEDGKLTGDDTNEYDAPTQLELKIWLIDRNINISTILMRNNCKYSYGLTSNNEFKYKTYEDAFESLLIEALKLIKHGKR